MLNEKLKDYTPLSMHKDLEAEVEALKSRITNNERVMQLQNDKNEEMNQRIDANGKINSRNTNDIT
jgi:hypothetical protein